MRGNPCPDWRWQYAMSKWILFTLGSKPKIIDLIILQQMTCSGLRLVNSDFNCNLNCFHSFFLNPWALLSISYATTSLRTSYFDFLFSLKDFISNLSLIFKNVLLSQNRIILVFQGPTASPDSGNLASTVARLFRTSRQYHFMYRKLLG